MSKQKKRILQASVSLVLLLVLLKVANVQEAARLIAGADPTFIILSFILVTMNRILMPLKWNLLLRAKSIPLSYYEAVKIYYISSFLGFVLPPTVGVDAVRVYYSAKANVHPSDVIASILIERIIGFIALGIFVVGGCLTLFFFFREVKVDMKYVLTITSISLLLLSLFLFFLINKRVNALFQNMILRYGPKGYLSKLLHIVGNVYQSGVEYHNKRLVLVTFSFLTCLEVCLPILRSYLVALALHIEVPAAYFFGFVPIILFLIRLPISFDGFGLHEGGFAYFLSLVGVSTVAGFSVGLVNHLVFLIGISPGGIWYALSGQSIKERMYGQERQTNQMPP